MRNIPRKIKQVTSTPRGKIIFLGVIIGLLGVIAGAVIYWGFYRKQIIRNTLEEAIRNKSEGLYKIRYDELELDEVAGNLSVTNFSLQFDSARYLTMKKNGNAPPALLKIHIPSLIVSGVKTPRALLSKEIVGKTLQLARPAIDIIYTYSGKDSARNVPTKEVYEQILGDLDLIRLDTILVTDARIGTYDIKTGEERARLYHTSIRLLDVAVDSAAWADTTRLLFARELELSSAGVSWKSSQKPYSFGIDSIRLSSEKKQIHIAHFHLDPLLPEDAFIRSLPRQEDRFDFSVKDISINDLDFPALFREEISAGRVTGEAASFKIYRDLGYKRGIRGPVKIFPHQALAKAPIPLLIEKIILRNTYIEYKERAVISRQAGKVRFHQSDVTITNLTNRRERASQNNLLTVDVRTRFLNRAPLHVLWKFHLFHPDGRFDITGDLGAIDVQAINALSVPMGPARMEKGKINHLYFNLSGNNSNMTGDVKLLYEDLKVSLLKKDEESKELEKKSIASLAANIMIKNSNPSGKSEPRVVHVNFQRDTHRSIFHLSWKSLFTGIKESAGIKK